VLKKNLGVFSILSSKTFALRQDRHPAYTTGLACYTTMSLCCHNTLYFRRIGIAPLRALCYQYAVITHKLRNDSVMLAQFRQGSAKGAKSLKTAGKGNLLTDKDFP